MIDLERLKSLNLSPKPWGQILLANLAMRWDYRFPRRTEIVIEGKQNIPLDRPVLFAMNHTDRFNYFPFMYQLYRDGGENHRHISVWVKGKYYENPLMGAFMHATNNIPLPSRGYVLTTEFRAKLGRRPSNEEYRQIRDITEAPREDVPRLLAQATENVPDLVRSYGGNDGSGFRDYFDRNFDAMMAEVLRLTRVALGFGLNVLVFPQGTRSIRLPKGHVGLVQVAQHLGQTIVPVGCNGCDHVYPTSSPFAAGGRPVYRIGEPLEPDGLELAPHRVKEPFTPFTQAAEQRYGDRFRALTEVVMDRINDLLDPEYQRADDGLSDGVQGVDRFI